MVDMPQVQSIRRMRQEGCSVTKVACAHRLSRPTVRKCIDKDDFNLGPPGGRAHARRGQAARRSPLTGLCPPWGLALSWRQTAR